MTANSKINHIQTFWCKPQTGNVRQFSYTDWAVHKRSPHNIAKDWPPSPHYLKVLRLIYLSRYLNQKTAKEPLRTEGSEGSVSSCHLLQSV